MSKLTHLIQKSTYWKEKVIKINTKSNQLLLALSLFVIILYLPIVLRGGFLLDDWGIPYISQSTDSFWKNLVSWFPLFINRPLAPFLLTAISRIFGVWTAGYAIVNLTFWITATIITGKIIERFTSKGFFILFFLLTLTPITATSIIFSPAMQTVGTFSFFLWSLSLLFLVRSLDKHKFSLLILSYLVLLAGFLVYEIILPLVVLNALLPLFWEKQLEHKIKNWLWVAIEYTIPVGVTLSLVLAYQKVVVNQFSPSISRIDATLNPSEIYKLFFSWLDITNKDLPILFISSIQYLRNSNHSTLKSFELLGIILVITLIFITFRSYFQLKKGWIRQDTILCLILLLSFLTSSFLYILSGRTAQVVGYENRGLSSTWITFSLLAAFLGSKLARNKLFHLLPIFIILCALTFTVERDNYITSAGLQEKILDDSHGKIIAQNIPDSDRMYLLANVPQFVSGNFINEEVFYNFWDFGYALSLKSQNKNAFANPLTYSKILDKKLIYDDQNIIIDGDWTAPYDKAWYYEYNQDTSGSTLTKIRDKSHFEEILIDMPATEKYISPPSFYWQTRDQVLNDPEYFSKLINN